MLRADVLLIDNVDSFTYNVADLIQRVLGRAPVVWRHDHLATRTDLERFSAIVVGPGPGRPQVATDMGVSEVALAQREIPVLGVCLGHQGMAHLAGERVVEMEITRHGIVSPVEHGGVGLFEGVPDPLHVVRYHSLEVREPLRSGLRVTARAGDDGSVMALVDPGAKRWGVQFHPESVLSEHGELIMANFLRLAGVPTVREVTIQVCRVAGGGADVTRAVDTWALHEELVAGSPTSVWLDSSDGSGASVLVDGTGPLAGEISHRVGDPEGLFLDRLDDELARWRLVGERPDLPFAWRPGFVGYLGYELKAETGGSAVHRSPWPDAWMLFADRGVVVDQGTGDIWALWLETAETAAAQHAWVERTRALVERIAERAGQKPPGPSPDPPGSADDAAHGDAPAAPEVGPVPRHDETAYLDLVRRCQQEIARGESYETCLTTTYQAAGTGVGEAALYRAMREVSPVPHGVWLRMPELSVLGCSPERFVSVGIDGTVEARPIKGTRPRGATPEQDAALVADLRSSQKDRAENLMIVDLLRNDLHRVCRAGSVHVPEIFAVQSYASVHQLVSTVRGVLGRGRAPTDVLRACFPGGSMTGAPKVRTMEILDALEDGPRGVYSGAIGWIGLDGSMDTSIVIRTVTWTPGGDLTFGVGGAITALSDPAEEYAETRAKARSILDALQLARTRGVSAR